MKILSVYQAYTKGADGHLPKCDYVSAGVPESDIALFESAQATRERLKKAEELLRRGANAMTAIGWGLSWVDEARAFLAAPDEAEEVSPTQSTKEK